jgi:hypothetical protein
MTLAASCLAFEITTRVKGEVMKKSSAGRITGNTRGSALRVMDSFMALERAGKRPKIEQFLKEKELPVQSYRPLLEGARALNDAFNSFRQCYPGVDIRNVYRIPNKV